MSRRQRHHKDRELTPYQQKLLDPRWQKKRLEILQRDEWACRECGDETSTLHVHHCWYEYGREPWHYPDDALITLCKDCHAYETENRPYAEQLLLEMLRMSGFNCGTVLRIAQAFEHWKLLQCCDDNESMNHNINACLLGWAMEHEEIMRQLYQQYTAYTAERLLQAGFDVNTD